MPPVSRVRRRFGQLFCSSHWTRRASKYQGCLDAVNLARRMWILCRGFQRRREFLGHLVAGQADGCQRRIEDIAELNIIEANDREVSRSRQTRSMQSAQRTNRGQIVGCKERRWPILPAQELGHYRLAAADS